MQSSSNILIALLVFLEVKRETSTYIIYQRQKAFATSAAILAILIIGFTRYYNGVHSLNQILYGWTLGVTFGLYNFFCLKPMLEPHIDRLLDVNKPLERNTYEGNSMNCLAIFSLTAIFTIGAYENVQKTFIVP